MDEFSLLKFNYDRRFGVEIELNSFDKRCFKTSPLSPNEKPEGIEYLAHLLMENLKAPVKIAKWHHTHNNFESWICKPDSSCGIEICSPATKGWTGLKSVVRAIDVIGEEPKVQIDERCSFHVHVDVEDLCVRNKRIGGFRPAGISTNGWNPSESIGLGSVLAWWVKCEPVFMDSIPDKRKRSKYAMPIGCRYGFSSKEKFHSATVINRLSAQKYFTCNCYHLGKGKRPTIEFRIVERDGCTNSYLAKNWIRLLVHFVEMAKFWGPPDDYLWLDPKEVFAFLGFSGGFELSAGLRQTRNWFLSRILSNMNKSSLPGIWSPEARAVSKRQAEELCSNLGLDRQGIEKYLREQERTYFEEN